MKRRIGSSGGWVGIGLVLCLCLAQAGAANGVSVASSATGDSASAPDPTQRAQVLSSIEASSNKMSRDFVKAARERVKRHREEDAAERSRAVQADSLGQGNSLTDPSQAGNPTPPVNQGQTSP